MTIGEVYSVADDVASGYHYVDIGSYDVPEYGAVYILDTERPAIIETGLGKNLDAIERAVTSIGIEPDEVHTIAITHVHLDHAGGAGHLLDRYSNASVVVHESGAPHLVDPKRLVSGTKRAVGNQWQYYREPIPVPEDRIESVTDGDVIDLGDRILEVHHVPGHAPHQVVYHDPDERTIVTGDAAGIWIPTTQTITVTSPPPNFDLDQCSEDVQLLEALDPKSLLFPHFGPVDSPARVLETYRGKLTDWVDWVATVNHIDQDDAVEQVLAKWPELVEAWGERKARDEVALNLQGARLYLKREGDTA